jgi:hypothetical protein
MEGEEWWRVNQIRIHSRQSRTLGYRIKHKILLSSIGEKMNKEFEDSLNYLFKCVLSGKARVSDIDTFISMLEKIRVIAVANEEVSKSYYNYFDRFPIDNSVSVNKDY